MKRSYYNCMYFVNYRYCILLILKLKYMPFTTEFKVFVIVIIKTA